MEATQQITRAQMQMFDAVSGYKEEVTKDNATFKLHRIGALLQIDCFVNNSFSHIVTGSYVHSDVMQTWNKIKESK